MKLIESYILKKIVRASVLSLVALGTTVWLTQALREFDLVSAMGQTIVTFFQITVLLLPALVTIVAPVALMIGVIYSFTNLNDGSELVVINASGARQWSLLKPVLIVSIATGLFMATLTLYLTPLSMRLWREIVTNVRGSVITSLLKEGEFTRLAAGLTFELKQRAPDGTLRGIFLSDSRERGETVTYLAERGAVLDNALGVFLVMSDGTIQRRNEKDDSISIIQFTSYAYDLSTFASKTDVPSYRPAERATEYLLDPDPDDRLYQTHPERYIAEFHTRLTTPLNAMVFGILPLVFLAQAQSTRQKRTATIGLAVASALGIAVIEFLLGGAAEKSMIAVIGLYAVPLLAMAVTVVMVLSGIQPTPPERLIVFGDAVAGFVKRLVTRQRPLEAAGG